MLKQGILFVVISLSQANRSFKPLVSSPLGQYQGSVLTNSFGQSIFSFRGIRYAEAPVKELRFKPPVPIKKHNGIFKADEDSPACPQITKDPISEDCLFLNVYTTRLPTGNDNPKRPVIIAIHPGGFIGGTGRSNWSGPKYLMNQDIVLVTFNYRLGILGFLSTGDKEVPGNNGLRDQVEAIKWVKQNIECFGGDSNSITLFGASDAGGSVSLHLVSPLTKGLFHKAIVSSTSTMGQFPLGSNQMDLVKKLAKILECPELNTNYIVRCLKEKSAVELVQSVNKYHEFGNFAGLLWKPVIEEDFGQERFLTDHPTNLVLERKFHKVPVISGIVSYEYANWAVETIRNHTLLKLLDEQWEKYAPIIFGFERYTERSKVISKELRSFYFGDHKLNNDNLPELIEIFGDSLSGFPVDRVVKLLAQKSSQSTFYYQFSYKGTYSHYSLPNSNKAGEYGPVHQDDLIYLFYISALFPEIVITDPEFRIVQKITTMWANFARDGKPITKTCGRLDYAEWEAFNSNTQKYMDIGNVQKMRQRLNFERYAKWGEIFPLSSYEDRENISY
ncbi:hypothetical protein WA026_001691 [Henosepilachna vigintioctopunctata]|uniref:Carboxylesterase type B domain-containing protein n=1 Tax=Henosepilachna vigintioctopunctata TaxID=420089 RepID=A0AAW1UR29_9CUCU